MTDVPPQQPFSPPPHNYVYAPQGTQTGLAVTAMVLGIAGLVMCPPAGIAAIITGIIALTRVNSEPQKYGGRGMAIAGLVCGALGVVVVPLLLIPILLPSLSRARELSKRVVCSANMRGIGSSLLIYENDYPGQGFPPLAYFVQTGDITAKQLVCPSSGHSPGQCSYILLPIDPAGAKNNPRTVLMYEPKSNHGGAGGNFLFLDGHVTFEKREYYDRLLKEATERK